MITVYTDIHVTGNLALSVAVYFWVILYSSGIVRCFNSLTYSVRERCTNKNYRAQSPISYPVSLQTLECQMEAHWHSNRLNLDQQLLRVDGDLSDNVYVFFCSLFLYRNAKKENNFHRANLFSLQMCDFRNREKSGHILHTVYLLKSTLWLLLHWTHTWPYSNSKRYNQPYPS